MYTGYSARKCIHKRATMQEGAYKSEKVIVRDRTAKEELLGFAGVVYSFLYFSMGHFPGKGALVSFDIILMIS
jgi:hypothetical protein